MNGQESRIQNPEHGGQRPEARARGFRVIEGGEKIAGRPPPHSLEVEQYLLSCCLLDGADTIRRCIETKLPATAFYNSAHRIVYEKIRELYAKQPPVELAMLAEELKTCGQLEAVGGYTYLTQITAQIPTTAQAEYFLEKVRELWLLRELIMRCTGAVEQCFNFQGGLAELMAKVDDDVRRVTQYVGSMNREKMSARAERIKVSAMDRMKGRIDTSRQLRLGLPGVDRVMRPIDVSNGFEEWMVVVGGVRSGGKSSLLRHLTQQNCEEGKLGVAFTLETGMQSWLDRAAGSLARINLEYLDKQPRDKEQLFRTAYDRVQAWIGKTLWIHDDVTTIDEIEVRTRELDRQLRQAHGRGLDFATIDYLQLIDLPHAPRGANREEKLSIICRRLHQLFKRLNVTVFVTAQVNRSPAAEKRRPTLADFRESGAIENTADVVLALHTLPENRAGMAQDEKSVLVEQELLILKRRNGKTGYEPILFNKQYSTFEDMPRRGDDVRPGEPMPEEF